MLRLIHMYIYLYFSINKNMFFEKYKFIKIKYEKQRLIYTIFFVCKNYLLILAGMCFIYFKFDPRICQLLIAFILLTELLHVDASDWRIFERNDFVMMIPKAFERSAIVLFGNMIYKFIINTNIFFYTVLLCLCDLSNTIYCLMFMAIYLIIAIVLEWSAFFVRYSTIEIKKIFGLIKYLVSMVSTVFLIYYFVEIILYFIRKISDKSFSVAKAAHTAYVNLKEVLHFAIRERVIIFIFMGLFIILCSIAVFVTIRQISDSYYRFKDENRYVIRNLWILRAVYALYVSVENKLKRKSVLTEKEFSLFADIFKYNYDNTWFVYLADRALAMLIAFTLILYKYNMAGVEYLLLAMIPSFFMLDINSATSVKLLVNMSFISDCNTLLLSNSNGLAIKSIINSKLRFFYIMKSFSIGIFFVVSNMIMLFFHCDILIFLLENTINVAILLLMPKCYLINNLIYTRMDYKDYRKYLDESNVLEEGIGEFIPINLLSKIMSIIVMVVLMNYTLGKMLGFSIKGWIILSVVVTVYLSGIIICSVIMSRIGKNIIGFIEKGDYSADISKIFK
ncbi:hypothetical protein SAMN04487934_105128 [Eubacterium ruminantium]|nr:hypothetical protein SAMN04487934_105128 [Eubacterium ruminantium]